MKTIGINGSPRKDKNSAELLKYALEGAESKGSETELIHLADLKFSGCLSCFACKRLGGKSFGRCALQDDLTEILGSILTADALIVSSPIYFGDVPGMVRNLFERIWFPGLQYRKDGSTAYTKKVRTGLIYTMGSEDSSLYMPVIDGHRRCFEWFLGKTRTLCSADTLQYDDYSLYSCDIFDAEHKRECHDSEFPKDCQKSFEMGAGLIQI